MLSHNSISLDNCTLIPSQIDVWQYSLQTMISGAYECLSDEEKQRADRFYFDHHRRRFIVGHYILRLILSRYINLPPQRLAFSTNHYGKPELNNMQELQFNLSHSGELALLAVGQTHPLGIDLEQFSFRSYEGIAQASFSVQENNALSQIIPALRPLGFFNIWSQKEALIKACGLGLSYPTKDFDVPLFATGVKTIHDHLHEQIWYMRSFMPHVACYAALCHAPQVDNIRYLRMQSHHLPLLIGECE